VGSDYGFIYDVTLMSGGKAALPGQVPELRMRETHSYCMRMIIKQAEEQMSNTSWTPDASSGEGAAQVIGRELWRGLGGPFDFAQGKLRPPLYDLGHGQHNPESGFAADHLLVGFGSLF
jgi:hypothetical protein